MRPFWLLLSICIISVISIISTGCSTVYPLEHYDLNNTKVFIQKKGIIHFSFRIPSCFENKLVEVRNDLGYIHLRFIGPGETLSDGKFDETLLVLFIDEKNESVYDVQSAIKHEISFTENLTLKDYRFIEESETRIAGIPVAQFVFYRNAGITEYPDDPQPAPIPTIVRNIFFEKNNLVWRISIHSNQNIESEAESVINKIIESLVILD